MALARRGGLRGAGPSFGARARRPVQLSLPERQGSLQVEMIAAAREQGLLVYPLAPELGAILREIDAGNAVLVMQNLQAVLLKLMEKNMARGQIHTKLLL